MKFFITRQVDDLLSESGESVFIHADDSLFLPDFREISIPGAELSDVECDKWPWGRPGVIACLQLGAMILLS